MDQVKSISFPSFEGRELTLKVNLKTGLATVLEVLDGESITVSTCITEIKTIAHYIELLEGTKRVSVTRQDRRKRKAL